MELTQLKQFKAVASTQNITTASQQLFISQPALTRTIYKLEDELGTSLFDRSDRKLKLNSIGKRVLAYVNIILSIEQELLDSLNMVEHQNDISICSSMHDILSFLIPKLYERFPELHIRYDYIKSRNAKYYLTQKKTDLVITDRPIRHNIIKSEILFDNYIIVSVPEECPLYTKSFLTFEDLKNKIFVTYIENNPAFNLIHNILTDENIKIISLANADACYSLAESEKYLFISSFISAKNFAFNTERRCIPLIQQDKISYTYFISFLDENEKKYRKLIDWIQHSLQ